MSKSKLLISIILFQLVLSSCTSKQEKTYQSNKVEAFEKINEKSKALFNKDARINSYKNSITNTENLRSSLEKNNKYDGYGASKKKTTKIKKQQKNPYQNKKTKKVNFRPSSSDVFSAYSTN